MTLNIERMAVALATGNGSEVSNIDCRFPDFLLLTLEVDNKHVIQYLLICYYLQFVKLLNQRPLHENLVQYYSAPGFFTFVPVCQIETIQVQEIINC